MAAGGSDGDRGARCRENLAAVRAGVADACRRAGRDVGGVTLIGVTKYVDAEVARLLVEAGCHDLAESRPQHLWEKARLLADAVPSPRWHLVGHLQRNKIRCTLPVAPLIHTLDSLRLLSALEAEAAAIGLTCDVLVEVALSDDPGRSGVRPADAAALAIAAAAAPHVRLRGLMGMAGHPDGAKADARRDFARLRELREQISGDVPPGMMRELSMGMSGDFAEAILEGATMVRIGSALVEGITDRR
jgi:PLP dependent protein